MMNPLSHPSYLLPPLITFAVSFLLIALVWRWARKSFSTLLFIGFLANIGLWAFLLFGMRSSPDVHHALIWERVLPAIGYATFVLYYHFTLVYTNTRGQRHILLAAYLYLAVVVALSPTELLIQRMKLEDYGYAPVMTPLAFPLMMSLPVLMFGGAYNLIRRYKEAVSYEERNRLLYLVVALLFPLIGSFLDAFSSFPPVGIWANLLFCIICTVAMVKYHLFDISLIMRRSLAYVLVSLILAMPYLGVLFIMYRFIGMGAKNLWIPAIAVLLVAIILRPISDWTQHLVDRLFYGRRYDYLLALEDFVQQTHDIGNFKQLTSSLANLIGPALQSCSVHLMLSSDSGDFFELPAPSQAGYQLKLNGDGPLMRWVRSKKTILHYKDITVIPQLQALTRNESYVLNKTRMGLIVPIVIKEELIGLIILGEKLSQLGYSEADERLIWAVAVRMATELENARLYYSERTLRKRLEAQDVQKTEFLHNVAHELKTPLSAVISSSELLSEEASVPSSLRKRLINNIRQGALSMERRVGELLDLASIQVGEMRVKLEHINLTSVINETSSQMRVLIESKQQKLKLEMPRSLPRVNGDRDKLQQVLFNLLSNANKFSPNGSEIILRARVLDSNISIEVEDSAPRLTDIEKKRIFEPYYRGEDTIKRGRFAGLGLGLSISKKLIELHNGEIGIESKSGKGNIFVFSLPISD
jgi:signal transduction histidine kinase